MWRWLRRGDRGASAVEYALIAAAIAAVLLPVAVAIYQRVDDALFSSCVSTAKENAGGPLSNAAAEAMCQ